VLGLILGPAGVLVGAGLTSGLILTILAAPLLRNLPLNVSSPDARTLWSAALLVSFVTAFACLMPARRLIAVDPATMLREE
jgi:ABC-type antimicrobial peptide transport system permease subunit